MNPAQEPCLQLLNRAYCYLRLNGVDADAACQQLHKLVAQLSGEPMSDEHDFWQQLWSGAAPIAPSENSPILLRGHIHYIDPDG